MSYTIINLNYNCMQYDKIKKRPVQFQSLTSLSVQNFNFLLPYFKAEWD